MHNIHMTFCWAKTIHGNVILAPSPSRSFPILVYFKETQTPEEFWNVGPGEQANSEEAIAKGAVPGQVHFFPAIANTEDLIKGFEEHGCANIE
mmetsp:Transcript_34213/g.62922  ORF Transcript_34213/g.62922 Transcript_34213/m.62922 type:complete len:93 (+) Transcript_34213:26-304(+)